MVEEAAAYWRAARLHLQLEKDHLLLLERATDALVCLHRAGHLKREEFPISIGVERVPRLVRAGKFPWRVVIVARYPEALRQAFGTVGDSDQGWQEWLGIGVDAIRHRGTTPTTSGSLAHPFGRCLNGQDGKDGVIGGLIGAPGEPPLGATCRHVLSSVCSSIAWPNPPIRPLNREFTQESPDAAFINVDNPCFGRFEGKVAKLAVEGRVLSQDAITLAARLGSRLRKSPDSDAMDGCVVNSEKSGFWLGDYFYRGPHVEIDLRSYYRFWLRWPLFFRYRGFSKDGHSGSWVVDTETRGWVGMIVGITDRNVSVAIAGHFLADAFSRFKG
jgi:hypothetical protein